MLSCQVVKIMGQIKTCRYTGIVEYGQDINLSMNNNKKL